MREDFLLLNPGPVPVAHEVTKAMDQPMISRRSHKFGKVYERVRDRMEYVFEASKPNGARQATEGESLIMNGTATMALEASVANLAAGGNIVVLANGAFGDRLRDIAANYANVTPVTAPWGEAIAIDDVAAAIDDDTDLVAMVHNETSTGLANPIAPVGAIADDHDALFLVDGVSSIGGMEFRVSDWDVDIAVTDPQKALASPPGISALFASETAQAAFDGEASPLYMNLEDHLVAASDRRTPYTCASPLIRALDVALERIADEGMSERIARHERYASAMRAGVTAMGLSPFPIPSDGATYSNTMTAVTMPEAASVDVFEQELDRRGVSVGGGIGPLGGDLFRVSNMGEVTPDQLLRGLHAIGTALERAGADVDTEAGVREFEGVIRDT